MIPSGLMPILLSTPMRATSVTTAVTTGVTTSWSTWVNLGGVDKPNTQYHTTSRPTYWTTSWQTAQLTGV